MKLATLFAFALAFTRVCAQDVQVVGSTVIPATQAATQPTTIAPDVEVIGAHTVPANSIATPEQVTLTRTECWQVMGSTSIRVYPTGTSLPEDAQCWRLWSVGGGVARVPVPTETIETKSNQNHTLKVVVPIVASIGGTVLLSIGVFVFMRYRRKAKQAESRTWIRRPGGWVDERVPNATRY